MNEDRECHESTYITSCCMQGIFKTGVEALRGRDCHGTVEMSGGKSQPNGDAAQTGVITPWRRDPNTARLAENTAIHQYEAWAETQWQLDSYNELARLEGDGHSEVRTGPEGDDWHDETSRREGQQLPHSRSRRRRGADSPRPPPRQS
jgi:hypothetical protein